MSKAAGPRKAVAASRAVSGVASARQHAVQRAAEGGSFGPATTVAIREGGFRTLDEP